MNDTPAVTRTRLGASTLEVPPLCFGTTSLGDMPNTYGYSVDEERARETVRAIFDGSQKFLDSSRNYGAGRSEQRVGEVIARHHERPAAEIVRHLVTEVRAFAGPSPQLDDLTARVREMDDGFSVADFRDRFGVTRKHAVPLLEWLDRRGITRRDGDVRRIVG